MTRELIAHRRNGRPVTSSVPLLRNIREIGARIDHLQQGIEMKLSGGRHSRCGWIAAGGSVDGEDMSTSTPPRSGDISFINNAAWFDAIHPSWFAVNADGTKTSSQDPNIPSILQAAAANGVEVIPLVAGVDNVMTLRSALMNGAALSNTLVTAATANNYNGLELDFEHLGGAADAQILHQFLQIFVPAMHQAGKVVSMAVPGIGKQYYAVQGNSDPVFDYATLMTLGVDQLHIMAYDFHRYNQQETVNGATGANAVHQDIGSVAPLPWVLDICESAKASGHPEKCSLGLPMYGIRNWMGDESALVDRQAVFPCGVLDLIVDARDPDPHLAVCNYNPKVNNGLLYTVEDHAPHGVQKLPPLVLELFATEVILNLAVFNNSGPNPPDPSVPTVAQANVEYLAAKQAYDAGRSFTWHFEDLTSLEAKVLAASLYGLVGVTFWNVGEEMDGFFQMVEKYY